MHTETIVYDKSRFKLYLYNDKHWQINQITILGKPKSLPLIVNVRELKISKKSLRTQNPHFNNTEGVQASKTQMADMAVSIAREKLLPLIRDEANLIWDMPKEFADLKDELEYIQAFLKDADKRAAGKGDNMKEGIRNWVKQSRESIISHRRFYWWIHDLCGTTASWSWMYKLTLWDCSFCWVFDVSPLNSNRDSAD